MNTYGWLLLGQTLLALLVLGLCGGWALWPFRRAERPFLWLAAPLAGLLTLGGVVAVLYFGGRVVPFRWCLWAGVVLNAAGTVACLVRGRPPLPPLSHRAAALAVVLGAAYWATLASNKTAIEAREPTIASLEGSDMYGYAITADWLRAHPAARPPRADEVFEVMAHTNLFSDGGRPVVFALAAAAAEARGTSGLFSYDWASGVVLAAAALGFGGAFAPGRLALVLLVAGAGASNWLAISRTGYLAKSVAYPGAVLLAALVLQTAAEPTRRRVAALAALGFALCFSLAPVFPAVVLGLVTGCHALARALVYPLARRAGAGDPFRAGVLAPAARAGLLCLVAVLPAFLLYYLSRDTFPVPGAPAAWGVVIPVSLDLQPTALPLVKPETEARLLGGCAALLLVLAGAALWARQPVPLGLLLCALVVPVSWALGQNLLFTFHGVTYPLTLAGAACLVVPPAAARRPVRVAALAVLVAGTVALRVPQARATADRYVYSAQPHRAVARQSDARAIRAVVGTEPLDVALGHFPDNHLVLAELVPRGVPVRFRPPGWERSLKNWAAVGGCATPDLFAPKARFTLVERNAFAPPGTERYVGSRLKLVEDRDAVTVLGVLGAQEMIWDLQWRPGVWVGNEPTTFLIHNGTGEPQFVVLHGDTAVGPAHADPMRRTLRYKLGGQTGALDVPAVSTAAVPVRLAPGLNRVELSVAEPATPGPPGYPVLLLAFCNWRLEPAAALPRTDQR